MRNIFDKIIYDSKNKSGINNCYHDLINIYNENIKKSVINTYESQNFYIPGSGKNNEIQLYLTNVALKTN